MNTYLFFDTNLLNTLHVLLIEKSVTRTAERLDLSQPAVSQMLKKIRLHFQDPILVLKGRHYTLSPLAQSLQKDLETYLLLQNKILFPCDFNPLQDPATFRIGASDYGSLVLSQKLIPSMINSYPHINIFIHQLSREAMIDRVSKGHLDFAVGVFEALPHRVLHTPLFKERFVCVVDQAHPLASKPRVSVKDYLRYDHALISVNGEPQSEIDTALALSQKKRRVRLVLPHFTLGAKAIKNTDLILTVAEKALGDEKDHDIVMFDPPFDLNPFSFDMISHERSLHIAPNTWFCREIKNFF